MRSIAESRDYTVAFDRTAETYSITPEGGAAGAALGTGWKGIDIYRDLSDGAVPPLSADDVVFRPNGSAATAGFEAVYLRNSPPAGERYRVKILGVTGKVTVEKWKGGSWGSAY